MASSTLAESRWNASPIQSQIHRILDAGTRGKVTPTVYNSRRQSYYMMNDNDIAEALDYRISFHSSLSPLEVPRGGFKEADRDIEISQNDDTDNMFLQKIRNVIRSVTQSTKNASPLLYQSWVSLIRIIESASGVRLMPSESSTTTKKKKKGKGKVVPKEKASVVDDKESVTTKGKKSTQSKVVTSTKGSGTASLQVKKDLKATNPNYRIQQELKKFLLDPPEHLSVKTGKNIRIWIVTMQGIGIYEGETFRLRIQFPNQYPTVPPSVYFLPPNIPVHEHVYTNGDICLSLLGKDWRPTMTAQSVAHSILSILASATSKSLPMDNARHAGNAPGQYQENWVYHDDNC